MIDELEQLRAVRPEAAPPRDTARADARARLRAAIGVPAAPARGRRGRRRWSRGLGLALPVLGSVAAVAIAIAAVVLLHHAPARTPAPAAVAGGLRSASGRPLSGPLVAPLTRQYAGALTAGNSLTTTIDPALQRAAERSLARSIADDPPADGGAYVALDPDTGAVEAIGSLYTGSGAHVTLNPRTGAVVSTGMQPDLAIASPGPVGSAFKPVTALAALESGVWSPAETFDDTGKYCEGGGLCIQNSSGAAYGVIDMVKAIQVSDDIFFYNLGARMNASDPAGGPLQQWAGRLGFGRQTGIDLPGEVAGQVESPAEVASRGMTWTLGDNVNAAVGQGDDQFTPLQLAVAYGALANGGTVVTPHVGARLTAPSGNVVRTIAPAPHARLPLGASTLATIDAGLRAAVQGGTSADVFANFGAQVRGMPGTAQYFDARRRELDYAWWAGFVPASGGHHPLVVVVTVRKGGFGDVAAAPVARQIISQYLTGSPGPYRQGSGTAR